MIIIGRKIFSASSSGILVESSPISGSSVLMKTGALVASDDDGAGSVFAVTSIVEVVFDVNSVFCVVVLAVVFKVVSGAEVVVVVVVSVVVATEEVVLMVVVVAYISSKRCSKIKF